MDNFEAKKYLLSYGINIFTSLFQRNVKDGKKEQKVYSSQLYLNIFFSFNFQN